MRVLYLLRYYPTLSETFVNEEIRGLRARGLEVSVASLGRREDAALVADLPDAPVLIVPRHPLRGRLQPPTAGQRWLGRHQRPKDVARLPWLLHAARAFDHVHVHFAGEAAELARALRLDGGPPYSVTTHAVDLFKPRPSLPEVLAGAARVLTISEHNAQIIRQLIVEHQINIPLALTRCGPDLERWPPTPLPSGPLRALFVGRAVPKKGLDLLLSAWEGLADPDARLELITADAPALPRGVHDLGPQPPAAVRAALTRANLFVLPCRRAPDGDLDGVPVSLMEAMAMGRPVLTTPVSGVPELVADDPTCAAPGPTAVGWLVPADDPDALRQALLSATPEERARRGSEGPARLRGRGFTLERQVSDTLAAFGLG